MKTLQMIAANCQATKGFTKGMSAKEFQKANPDGALKIARLIEANVPQLVREMSAVLAK